MSLFQDIVNHSVGSPFPYTTADGGMCITRRDGVQVNIQFYPGGSQIHTIKIVTEKKSLIFSQTYSDQEVWALYKQEIGSLVLFSHHGKTEIMLT